MKKQIIRRELSTENLDLGKDIHPVLKRIYAARGIHSHDGIKRDLTHLLPYNLLTGINDAVTLLADALAQNQRIIVVGDFDSDGATSTALAVRALQAFGSQNIKFLIPNRFEFGYGLTPEIVKVAAQLSPDVLITVDSGIASHAGVIEAVNLGMKVIITDHHLPAVNGLPHAHAIVNPQLTGDGFASKNLAGVGVIFYVMVALRQELKNRNWFATQQIREPNMAQFLDLVALGTVADLVPLDQNNRILIHHGIQRIRSGKAIPGIYALFQIAGKQAENIVTADLGFSIAPRLNAAGRLTDMKLGVECLLTDDFNKAYEYATQLSLLNEERKHIEKNIQQQAQAEIKKISQENSQTKELPFGMCLFDETWHQGVIGLIASRIKDKLHRPVIIFAPDNDPNFIKGSARSIPGLHIRDALDAIAARYPNLIAKFGGHAMAAGLTLAKTNFPDFCTAFDAELRLHLSVNDLKGVVHTDGELTAGDFNLDFVQLLRDSGPWGQAFPEPIFDGRFKVLQQLIVGNKHLKLTLADNNSSQQYQAIAFNINNEEWPNHRVEYIHAAYRLDINEYMGRKTLQLIIEQFDIC